MTFFDKVNDFAKNVGEVTTEMTKTVGDRIGDAVETTKLYSKISSEKSTIKSEYQKLGEYYYTKYKSNKILELDIDEICTRIDKCNEKIAQAQAQIEKIKSENKSETAGKDGSVNSEETKDEDIFEEE